MWKSRKALLAEIKLLKDSLEETKNANRALSELIRTAGYGYCIGCKNSTVVAIGDGSYKCVCKKKLECEDFTPENSGKPNE